MNGGVALAGDEGLIAELRLNVKTTHSERLLPGLDYLLKQTGLELEQIDILAVSHGPGSFTGLRVGISLVKGIAFAYGTGKKVVAVPTLEAFAWHFPFSCLPVCPLLDARRGELYGGIFLWREGEFTRVVPEAALPPDKWIELARDALDRGHDKIVLMGEGSAIYGKNFRDSLGGRALFAPPSAMSPSPANVALLGVQMAAKGLFADPEMLVPFYIRKSEAELKLKQSHPAGQVSKTG